MNVVRLSLLLVLLTTLVHCQRVLDTDGITLVHHFPFVDFWYDSEDQHQEYLNNKIYEKVVIAGIKVYKDEIYVSLPRWKTDDPLVPTLAKIVTKDNETRLEAFPSWDMNTIFKQGNNETLFSVLGFEIDSKGRMWVLDQGKVAGKAAEEDAIKLVIYDLEAGEIVQSYVFSDDEASKTNSFLNDVVVDTSNNVAYIADSGIPIDKTSEKIKPAILIYDLDTNVAKRMLDSVPSTNIDENLWIETPTGRKCLSQEPMQTGVDGIALSCDFSRLYWTPLTSRTLYGIDTDTLLMYSPEDPVSYHMVNQSVVEFGNKISASDGLACSAKRKLYLTALETSTIYQLDNEEEVLGGFMASPSKDFELSKSFVDLFTNYSTTIDANNRLWPDTLAFDGNGYLYAVMNNLCDFIEYDTTRSRGVFIYKLFVDDTSYVGGCETKQRKFGIVEIAVAISCGVAYVVSIALVLIVGFAMRLREKRKASSYSQVQ